MRPEPTTGFSDPEVAGVLGKSGFGGVVRRGSRENERRREREGESTDNSLKERNGCTGRRFGMVFWSLGCKLFCLVKD